MNTLNKSLLSIIGLLLLATIAVRHASPIKDGDFFWHAAYAKYMIENKTLIPDHTIYSWTPADNTKIKCNWLAEILLYLTYKAGGLNLLFASRYFFFALVILILMRFTLKAEKKLAPLHLFVISISLFSSLGASFIKPELFSFIYFSLLYFIYFNSKLDQANGRHSRLLFCIPLIFLLWVNSHEVVLFGLLTFGLIYFGEVLNYLFNRSRRPSILYMKHLSIAAIGTVIVFFINPYGFKFPLNLVQFLLRSGEKSFGGIEAYNSIFSPTLSELYYFEYWIIMFVLIVSIIAYLLWKHKEIDWAIILSTIFLSAIYLKYVRATYYWPPFWAMSTIYLLSRLKTPAESLISYRKPVSVAVCLLMVFLSYREIDASIRKPFLGQHFGFGPGYTTPVQSVSFLEKHRPGKILYNSYVIGGYLTYALYPAYQIFIDSRYFPYISWYENYYKFDRGTTSLETFTDQYPFDVAILDYLYPKGALNEFILSKDWKLAFYGISAAVFVKKHIALEDDPLAMDPKRFDGLRTVFQAYTVFNFALNVGDWQTAQYLYELIKDKFTYMKDYKLIFSLSTLSLRGMQAMQRGDFELAYTLLDSYGLKPYMRSTNKALLQLRNKKVQFLVQRGHFEPALSILEKNIEKLPYHLNSLYNAGVIGYMLEKEGKTKSNNINRWRSYLKKVTQIAKDHQAARISKMLLEGKPVSGDKIPLMF